MRRWRVRLVLLTAASAALYFARCAQNPPGFYIDEASVAYNAHTIATSGVDEHGVRFPLYFQAFGDYKNPTFIYLLAALFWFTGPSIVVARILSVTAGLAAAAAIGLLAKRITRSDAAGVATALSALLTPWLFETSRVALEVALYPLTLALFLLSVHRAANAPKWSLRDVLSIAATLALLTYTYSIGRLLGPFFAAGLLLLWSRAAWRHLLLTWAIYGASLTPLLLFTRTNPGALTGRFIAVTYLNAQRPFSDLVREFAARYVGNLDAWRLLVTGDPNPDQITHLHGTEHFLAGTFVFAALGLVVVLRRHLHERWWRFFLYAAVIAPLPASLTTDYFHALRLIALPVVLLVLAAVGVAWLLGSARGRGARAAFTALVAVTIAQAAVVQWRYHRSAFWPRRVHLFDGHYRDKIFTPALASSKNAIYLADAPAIPGYIQAYWHATLGGIDLPRFIRLAPDEPPPAGAVVISTEPACTRCDVVARVEPYTLYSVNAPPPACQPLSPDGQRAELVLLDGPQTLRRGGKATYRLRVKNISTAIWIACAHRASSLQITLGNHWLTADGEMMTNDDGRAALLHDLVPGGETELELVVTAPRDPGDYLLEFDMLQEGVAWFAAAGSRAARTRLRVE